MPKIAAPTVAEHREMVRTRLVDAAEAILREPGGHLTAGAVTARAGIARNSVYRYVDSVEDLRALVVERYLPAWLGGVTAAMDEATSAEDRVVAWVRVNLEQAAATGHGWLMEAARPQPPGPGDRAEAPTGDAGPAGEVREPVGGGVAEAHSGMRGALAAAWGELLPHHPEQVPVATGLVLGLLDAGFRQLDRGQPVELVVRLGTTAARAVVRGLASEAGAQSASE